MTKIIMTYHPVKPEELEVHRLALLVIQGMIEQAVVSRWGKLDEVWLARSRKRLMLIRIYSGRHTPSH